MSTKKSRNLDRNLEKKRTARERLQAERAATARRATIRKRFVIAGCAATVLAFAAGIGIGVTHGTSAADDSDKPLVIPAGATGTDGTVITYGKRDAKATVKIYEDMRCPYCADFEQQLGPTLKKMADSGKAKVEFHMAAFLDKSLGGKGSKTSLAALGAALNESPDKFKAFHDVLYANHPKKETDDAFGSTATLLELAAKVPGLRTPAFNKAVKEGTYLPWATKVADAFYKSDVSGTPTVKVKDKQLNVIGADGRVMSPEDFTREVDRAAGAK
ncbi:thioredoxin domain-containing protein [Actinomycetota bacterium Odt1-20B]